MRRKISRTRLFKEIFHEELLESIKNPQERAKIKCFIEQLSKKERERFSDIVKEIQKAEQESLS